MFFLLYYLLKVRYILMLVKIKKILVLVNFDNIKIWKICYVNWKKRDVNIAVLFLFKFWLKYVILFLYFFMVIYMV